MNQYRTILKDVEIDVNLDKTRVFHAIDCKEGSPVYEEVNQIYKKMLDLVDKTITPMIIFEFHENKETANFEELKNSNIIIYNFVTLGEEISTKVEELFKQGDYLEAMVLDTMTNELLFNMTENAYRLICREAKEKGISLKARISPGDEEVPFHYQKHIWEKLDLKKLGVQVNDSYTFQPLKSIGFIYTTVEGAEKNEILHNCGTCKNLQCKIRRVVL